MIENENVENVETAEVKTEEKKKDNMNLPDIKD